jgi:hypothetical protein
LFYKQALPERTEAVRVHLVQWLGHELDSPGFESQHGQEILSVFQMTQTGYGTQPASYSTGTGVLSWAWCWPLFPYSDEVKNERN